MSNETWIEIAKWLGQLAAAALGGWVTARYAAKYSRTADTPAEKQPSRTLLLLRRMGSFIKRNWPGFIILPLSLAWPLWAFFRDATAPVDDVRFFVVQVALSTLQLALISSFWVSLIVVHWISPTVVTVEYGDESDEDDTAADSAAKD